MTYMISSNGITDHHFGLLCSPKMGIPEGVKNGMLWAADMGALRGPSFVKRFDVAKAIPWLKRMEPYRSTCQWILAPDVVGDAEQTNAVFSEMAKLIGQWPLAYAAQDGQERWIFPLHDWVCLFVGGSTEWKESEACAEVIRRAQKKGKLIHIGRVNSWRRYEHFRRMDGSDYWTCDGTKQRFIGIGNAVKMYERHMHKNFARDIQWDAA